MMFGKLNVNVSCNKLWIINCLIVIVVVVVGVCVLVFVYFCLFDDSEFFD